MTTWLIVDLRHNRCAVGLLTVGQGRPEWFTERMLNVYISLDIQDPRTEADLTFFRDPRAKIWSPVLRSTLPNIPARYEKIAALFAEPSEQLHSLLPDTLWPLLRVPLKQYPGIPLLLLIDRLDVQASLEDSLAGVRQEGQICVVSEQWGTVAGFTLLDSSSVTMPTEGATWLCRIEEPPQARRYTWRENRFEVEEIQDTASFSDISVYKSEAEMERIGAALFALVWRERLSKILDTEINALRRELEEDERLLGRLKGLYKQLTAGKILPLREVGV